MGKPAKPKSEPAVIEPELIDPVAEGERRPARVFLERRLRREAEAKAERIVGRVHGSAWAAFQGNLDKAPTSEQLLAGGRVEAAFSLEAAVAEIQRTRERLGGATLAYSAGFLEGMLETAMCGPW
jgi:hypothetical protein